MFVILTRCDTALSMFSVSITRLYWRCNYVSCYGEKILPIDSYVLSTVYRNQNGEIVLNGESVVTMKKSVSVNDIKLLLEKKCLPFRIQGNPQNIVDGFSSLSHYREGTITWNNSQKNLSVFTPHVSVCVVQEGIYMESDTQIISPNSKAVFFSILEHFWGDDRNDDLPAVGPGTVIGSNVHMEDNVRIGCNCSLIGDITIGSGTVIYDNVVIRNRVRIGRNCTIQSLTVIGEDGYGYSEDESHVKTMIRHFGGVNIGDNVFIGNHTNIARGTIDDTMIGSGTKIAPSTLIAHNNDIGENVSIVCAKLFGSVKVGDNAYVSSCIVRNQIKIGCNTIVGMGSVVTKDVDDNKIVMGTPAKVIRENNGKEKL